MEYKYTDLDFKLAERYVSCVLSMDELYRKQQSGGDPSLAKEGLVPVILSEFKHTQMNSYDEARAELKDIYSQYATAKMNDVRKSYMLEQVQSVINLGDWVFAKREFTYRELVQATLFVNQNTITEHQLERERKRMFTLLADKGYKGNFIEKFEQWKKDHLVKPSDLQATLDEMTAETQRLALNLGFEEVADVEVKCVIEHDRPYSGYCDYPGKTIYINGDMEYTYPQLKHLMTHEVHLGHITHMHVRKLDYEKGLVPADTILVITNTASSGVFEGLADNAQLFIGWDKEVDDEIGRIYSNLTAMTSIKMAHMMHEENIAPDVVKRYFRETLGKNEAAGDSKIRFLTFPHRRPFIYSYWRGNEAVRQIYLNLEKHETWEFLRFAYHNMHSVNSISQFLSWGM